MSAEEPRTETGPAPRPMIIENHRTLPWVILAACVFIIISTIRAVPYLGAGQAVIDFDAFYIVSQMIRERQLDQAYDVAVMIARQSALAGRTIFMPWTYPPQFDMLIAPLSFASRGVSYGIFTGLGLLAYVAVLRRLAGPLFCGALFGIAPALFVTILVGQNGLFLGALIGLVCLFWLSDRKARAGIALGLLVIKPHLALGIGFLVLISRQWRMLIWAAAVVLISSLLATLAFGPGIWTAFLSGARAAGQNMGLGIYPFFRMTSVYALLFTLGLSPSVAFAGQVVSAGLALTLIGASLWCRWPLRRVLGVACIATLAISPYNYDYDMPALGIAFALLARDLIAFGHPVERALIWASCWLCAGSGLFTAFYLNDPKDGELFDGRNWLALGSLGFLLMAVLIFRVLLRAGKAESVSQTAPALPTGLTV